MEGVWRHLPLPKPKPSRKTPSKSFVLVLKHPLCSIGVFTPPLCSAKSPSLRKKPLPLVHLYCELHTRSSAHPLAASSCGWEGGVGRAPKNRQPKHLGGRIPPRFELRVGGEGARLSMFGRILAKTPAFRYFSGTNKVMNFRVAPLARDKQWEQICVFGTNKKR